jgi:putative ABC transport system permease protein
VAGTGAVLGLLLAAAAAMAIQGLLVGLSPTDAIAFIAAAVVLGAVLLAAALIPARRAAGADPAVALRAE